MLFDKVSLMESDYLKKNKLINVFMYCIKDLCRKINI